MNRFITISIEEYDRLRRSYNPQSETKAICDEIGEMIEEGYKKDPTMESWDVWEPIYDKVFGGGLCKRVRELNPGFDWYDPDTTYYEDVHAFYSELRNLVYGSGL